MNDENKVAVSPSRPLICYACLKHYDLPDFFLLLVDDDGNAWNYADIDPYIPEANQKIIEVEICPHCAAEL